jgi:hypothetical protein
VRVASIVSRIGVLDTLLRWFVGVLMGIRAMRGVDNLIHATVRFLCAVVGAWRSLSLIF